MVIIRLTYFQLEVLRDGDTDVHLNNLTSANCLYLPGLPRYLSCRVFKDGVCPSTAWGHHQPR